MFLIAAMAAAVLTSPSPHPLEKRRRRPTRTRTHAAESRLDRNALLLALRRELLHDFLVETASEKPAFLDARIVDAGEGLRIGPTSVDVDFLGSPVVRARVVNGSDRVVDAIVIATVIDARGTKARASAWIERLSPHADRTVELFCPDVLAPVSVRWTVTRL